MVFPVVCSTCGRDLSNERFRLIIRQERLKVVLRDVRNICCRIKLATQIEPHRNLTVTPMLDIS
ncbi:ORF042 RNA polymerase subunit RPO7 [Bovine papular stomatitis virus]|uniref:DNA-directed RNA polymerase 7 kDa subunit n=1 Tax=Bovine papular stomatitis virus TaxID=129727 RepID=Q6TVE6_9POXV|nr:RNA polymerase [Bovine papular stomatitis virus]AAR98399.1 ORF042 RNA polymerase subunit RPO7 [Bovine papular stomatitis virus]AKC03211.1 RNA polymerase subunit RPO7 [Bovine papular stomatitis virus]AKC03340.1 RNA polymerase subunit RPO7 [Bovine papular stomatitis virus]AKC03468.1 RNA polymerase subunit RPO7 [Bovine papular stomatitis virus]